MRTKTNNNIGNRNMRKEAAARARARRIRSLQKKGLTQDQLDDILEQMDNRMVLVLVNGSYTIHVGSRKKRIVKRDEHHKKIGEEYIDVPHVLFGGAAAKAFAEREKLHILASGSNYLWILTNKDNIDQVSEKLKLLGRLIITKPNEGDKKPGEKGITKKSTNNTAEAKKAAKEAKKASNKERAEMRPYYAAKRKGGVSERIKKYNKPLAEKIEKWLKEQKASEESRKKGSKEERAKHRQLTSLEMKANKRARKVAKQIATRKRIAERNKKRAEENAKRREAASKKPVQTELKVAA